MSRKKQAPKRDILADARYGSPVVSKFINAIMYDGKRFTAEKIIYNALDKIKEKSKLTISGKRSARSIAKEIKFHLENYSK